MKKNNYSFLAIGKTQESTETSDGFKRYIGVGSTFVKAVNPNKKKLDEIMGFESANEPEYLKDGENGKEAHIHFIIETDPQQCNGIDIKTRLMFVLRQAPAYNRDQTKVQVIDGYGNHVWADTEDAKAGKKLLSSEGKELKIDSKYRMACVGECDLIDFLKAYLVIQDAFNYVNGAWTKKDNAEDCVFALEHIKDYFKGDFSELSNAIALRPNNKVKLLYGVRTTDEGRQYQAVASRGDLILRNSAGSNALSALDKRLSDLKDNGAYPNTEFKVQELQEYNVEATNLEKPAETSSDSDMPWD
mgnify:CR=1 FL=1